MRRSCFNQKSGEETSPTPQTDWSLAHGLKATFDLNFYGTCDPKCVSDQVSLLKTALKRSLRYLVFYNYCAKICGGSTNF